MFLFLHLQSLIKNSLIYLVVFNKLAFSDLLIKVIVMFLSLQFVITLLMKNVKSLALVIASSVLPIPHTCKR